MKSFDLGAHKAQEHQDREVSRWELRRYFAEELDVDRRREIEAELAKDSSLAAELAELKAEKAAFQTQHPLPRFMADHQARQEAEQSGGWFGRLLQFITQMRVPMALATAAGCVAIFLAMPGEINDGIRSKGGSQVGFFIQLDQGVRAGHDGVHLAPGARIQFAVKSVSQAQSMVLVGVDGTGAVTTYAAQDLSTTSEKGAAPGHSQLLGDSLILDDAIGPERFFVVYSKAPLRVLQTKVQAAADALVKAHADLKNIERLDVEALSQSSIHIIKVPND